MKGSKRLIGRLQRKERIAKKIRGTKECPRLAVFRSNKHIYAQLIDDLGGCTLVSASTKDKEIKGRGTLASAREVGTLIAKKAVAKGVKAVVFDRAGFRFHGQVKALAEGTRQGGLKF